MGKAGSSAVLASRLLSNSVTMDACVDYAPTSAEGGADDTVAVTNLSNKPLSQVQLNLLKKGLNFVPTKRQHVTHIMQELKEWERLMRIKEFWHGQNQMEHKCNRDDDLQYKVSHWTPERGRDPWLDLYLEEVSHSILAGVKKSCRKNLSKAEEEALYQLMTDDDIVIRPADKGSGIVVLDRSDYLARLQDEVNDDSTYKKTNGDLTMSIQKKVKDLADRLRTRGFIGKYQHQYLIQKIPQPGLLQGNPKLHKKGAPLRVIVSGRGHPTERVAELAESELRSHVESQSSYVRDTTDFINKIGKIKLQDNKGEEDLLLFCMDVRKLYPSVPRKEGIEACRRALDARKDPHIPTPDVLEMIELVLDNNNFSLGSSEHYVQVEGTAIGSKLGRNYACTYLGQWEKDLLASAEKKPLVYLRFIDDIFGVWTHGAEALKAFGDIANSLHPKIQLDLRFSKTSIEFLDVTVHLEGSRLTTDVYTKPTDTRAYLHFDSDHPRHTKRAVPYGLAVRAKRICSNQSRYQRQKQEIHSKLRQRGYPARDINLSLERAGGIDRATLLEKKTTTASKDGVPLVLTYSAHLPNINKVLATKRHILHRSDRLKEAFSANIFTSYKRGTNLRDILVHKKTKQLVLGEVRRGQQCGKNCVVCRRIYHEKDTVCGQLGTCTYDKSIGCLTNNVIYGIFCRKCEGVCYVGETGGKLYTRVQNHLSTIRTGKTSFVVSSHFNGEGHTESDLEVVGLEKVWRSSVVYRRLREQRWMGFLGTNQQLGGLNKKRQ